MSVDNTEEPGTDLISLNDGDVQSWCEKLGVSRNELQVAVEKVGPAVKEVRRFLHK